MMRPVPDVISRTSVLLEKDWITRTLHSTPDSKSLMAQGFYRLLRIGRNYLLPFNKHGRCQVSPWVKSWAPLPLTVYQHMVKMEE